MDLQEQAESILTQVREHKRHLWMEHGERVMEPSMFFLLEGHEELEHIPPFVVQSGYRVFNDLATTALNIFGTAKGIWEEHGEEFPGFRMIGLAVDAYGFTGEVGEDIPESLTEDFKNNPESKVGEMLTVTLAVNDLVGGCQIVSRVAPYSIADGGGIVFGDAPEVDDESSESGGRVASALRQVFDIQRTS